jgi:hypothetical protein
MQYFKLAAFGLLALALSSYAAYPMGQVKAAVNYQGTKLDDNAYRPGVGVNGAVGQESNFAEARGAGGFGVRANYSHYNIEGDEIGSDLNEGGVALTGLIGPNLRWFQPRLGGHAGYARVEDNNYFDFGPDITADFKFAPEVGIQAMATPYWFSNQNRTDYEGTKLGLGVVWSLPGA